MCNYTNNANDSTQPQQLLCSICLPCNCVKHLFRQTLNYTNSLTHMCGRWENAEEILCNVKHPSTH